jgi:hypothetical protein
MNAILSWMIKNNIPLTVPEFVSLNSFGQKTARQLEGEDRIEVQEFRDAVKELRKKS